MAVNTVTLCPKGRQLLASSCTVHQMSPPAMMLHMMEHYWRTMLPTPAPLDFTGEVPESTTEETPPPVLPSQGTQRRRRSATKKDGRSVRTYQPCAFCRVPQAKQNLQRHERVCTNNNDTPESSWSDLNPSRPASDHPGFRQRTRGRKGQLIENEEKTEQ